MGEVLEKMLQEAEEQYRLDTSIPLDHPERTSLMQCLIGLKTMVHSSIS